MHLKLEDWQLSVSERSNHEVNGRLPAREEGVGSNFTFDERQLTINGEQYPLYPRVAFWEVKMAIFSLKEKKNGMKSLFPNSRAPPPFFL